MKCDPDLLWTLVQQSEEFQATEGIYRHIERCSNCQRTLQTIAGGENWDREAQEWLSGEDDQEPHKADAPQESNDVYDLSFLGEPKQRDMLGRLGRYDIEGVVGRGGMGIVLRGFDTDLQRSVAIKVLAPEWSGSERARQRFTREAQAAASVVHDNVMPIHNVQSEHRPPFLVMPFIMGESLDQLVRRQGPLHPETILRLAIQIADGLAAAHKQGLVHRDVKPANVMVAENVDRVWLTDFGLARAADEAAITHTGVIAGTPHYMSPEQACGQPLDARSDLFSFGSLIHFLCVGSPPFDAPTTLAVLGQIGSASPRPLEKWRRDLPPSLTDLVHRLLQKKPNRRPRDMNEVVDALEIAMKELTTGVPWRTRVWRQASRWKGLAAAAAILLGTCFFWINPWNQSGEVLHSAVGDGDTNDRSSLASMDPVDSSNPADEEYIVLSPERVKRLYESVQSIDEIPGWQDARFDATTRQIQQEIQQLSKPLSLPSLVVE